MWGGDACVALVLVPRVFPFLLERLYFSTTRFLELIQDYTSGLEKNQRYWSIAPDEYVV